jgi:hypothetical protein
MSFEPRCVLLEIFDGVCVVSNFMLFEKTVELVTSLEAQEQSRLIGGRRAGTIAFDRERLQCLTGWICPLCEVVGKLNRDLHGLLLSESDAKSILRRRRQSESDFRA